MMDTNETKKNYIYRLMMTGKDYADLASLAEDLMQDIADYYPTQRTSKPHFYKIKGGYQAVVVLYDGTIIRRRIDVFKPIERKSNKKVVVDQSSRSLDPSYNEYEYYDED
jgi:hypothetical protein